jgi:N-carbamoylputrescine amidase
MRVTVCQLRNNKNDLEHDWQRLIKYLASADSNLLLLPEMPFSPWLAETDQIDEKKWNQSVAEHDHWLSKLEELPVSLIAGTRPVLEGDKRYNEGFLWDSQQGYQPVHRKVNLPNEEGWWEASWYDKGPGNFDIVDVGDCRIGFLICSELWFNEHAREYMKQNVDILVTPRATPIASVEKWITAGKTASLVSGAYSLSSNFAPTQESSIDWGGKGWVIEPFEGEILVKTNAQLPFQTVEIDLSIAREAKFSYPRNIE